MDENAGGTVSISPPALPVRRYDKGERRRKHVGRGKIPSFIFDKGKPRKVVGKCPATIGPAECSDLLQRAIPLFNPDRDLAVPKKVYAVSQGAIYEAQTSDGGQSYHGYPFRGKLS